MAVLSMGLGTLRPSHRSLSCFDSLRHQTSFLRCQSLISRNTRSPLNKILQACLQSSGYLFLFYSISSNCINIWVFSCYCFPGFATRFDFTLYWLFDYIISDSILYIHCLTMSVVYIRLCKCWCFGVIIQWTFWDCIFGYRNKWRDPSCQLPH